MISALNGPMKKFCFHFTAIWDAKNVVLCCPLNVMCWDFLFCPRKLISFILDGERRILQFHWCLLYKNSVNWFCIEPSLKSTPTPKNALFLLGCRAPHLWMLLEAGYVWILMVGNKSSGKSKCSRSKIVMESAERKHFLFLFHPHVTLFHSMSLSPNV